jgi:SAM-dependent methyltransferase
LLLDLLSRLARRDAPRTEADVQADVRQLFLTAPFQLEEGDVENVYLESPLGDRRRIDVEVGSTVVEVKRDLRRGKVKAEAIEQLAGYVERRAEQTGRRYVGVLTDGADWICYNLVQGDLQEVSHLKVTEGKADLDRLVVWLEGVLATAKGINPTASEIAARLGAGSSAHALDRATLASLYSLNREAPTIQMKRTLWSRLLTSALGTQFTDSDELFIEHTLLVNSAEIIAHAVLGLPVEELNPASLLSGNKFDESGIHGVVEADFFDWVLEVDGGEKFVRALSRRLGRFDWRTVEQDVLKVLYESVIGAATRKQLGEYYTPDWLAEEMVDATITAPLTMRVLDAACGSGTFLFHAVRKYIAAAEAASQPLPDILEGVTKHVYGMDLHPVAVTLARVTYLLALGRARLIDPSRGSIQIPVFLGDSIQWREQQLDLWTAGNLIIHTDDNRELFSTELRFPDSLLESAAVFDQLVDELATRASAKKPGNKVPSLSPVFQRLAIPEASRPVLEATFKTMCRLHDEGRDHVWGYYVRNLARPMWLSRESNRVDVLIGNPPWLTYNNMTPDMQAVFRRMSERRGLWAGAELATQQDLSGLFVARAAQLYLRKGGRLAMVLPNAALDREHYAAFRSGDFPDPVEQLSIQFDGSWDLRRIRPHFFPRAAGVVFGRREETSRPLSDDTIIWSGRVKVANAPWSLVQGEIVRTPGKLQRIDRSQQSSYESYFTQGASIVPRYLFFVAPKTSSPLGLPAGKVAVASLRSANEKKPWKNLPDAEGVIESEFVRPVLTGDTLLPYRTSEPILAVLPCSSSRLLRGAGEIEMYPGLEQWWRHAEESWIANRTSDRLSLFERLDYQSTLSKQLPIPPLRLIYNKSGMHLVAAKVKNPRAVIAGGLYWASMNSEDEADYLCAIMNSAVTTEALRPFMSYGKDERDIHKHVWQLPIETYDPQNPIHTRLVALTKAAETIAAAFEVQEDLHFAATRRHIRERLEASGEGAEISQIVEEMLS